MESDKHLPKAMKNPTKLPIWSMREAETKYVPAPSYSDKRRSILRGVGWERPTLVTGVAKGRHLLPHTWPVEVSFPLHPGQNSEYSNLVIHGGRDNTFKKMELTISL